MLTIFAHSINSHVISNKFQNIPLSSPEVKMSECWSSRQFIIIINYYYFFYNHQVFWPASPSKIEECQMAGKDPTVRRNEQKYSRMKTFVFSTFLLLISSNMCIFPTSCTLSLSCCEMSAAFPSFFPLGYLTRTLSGNLTQLWGFAVFGKVLEKSWEDIWGSLSSLLQPLTCCSCPREAYVSALMQKRRIIFFLLILWNIKKKQHTLPPLNENPYQ